MTSQRLRDIKRAQKESFLLKELAQFLLQIIQDDKELEGLYINRVKLSPDGGLCTIFFLDHNGKPAFEKKIGRLILYKPSIRSALSKSLETRYTPELKFKYDETFEKQQRIEELLDKLKDEGKL